MDEFLQFQKHILDNKSASIQATALLQTDNIYAIDPSHKSHNASDKYPMMYHYVTEMCTHVHISVTKWCIVGYVNEVNNLT